jgi:excisionase family DNA binding protein
MDVVETTKRLLTPTQAAEMLGVNEQTLAVWRSQGRYDLPYVRVGRCVRYKLSDVEQWIAMNTVGRDEK